MELHQLEAFLAVAEELHFGRAADRLHVAQPPLSRTIKQLERDLGAHLFERTTRNVRLTGAGEALLEPARQALESCVSCHVERECLTCHSQVRGRGFSPHGPGFDGERLKRKNPGLCVACHAAGSV